FRHDIGLDGTAAGHAADVERTERKLRPGLADRLRGDHAHDLALLDHSGRSKVAAVALRADAATGLARQHRTDLDRFERRLLDRLGDVLRNLFAGSSEHLARERVHHVVERRTAQNAVVERLHYVV